MNIATASIKRCLQLFLFALALGFSTNTSAQTFSVSPNSEDSAIVIDANFGATTQQSFLITNNTGVPTTVYGSIVANASAGFTLPGLGMVTVPSNDTASLYVNFLPTSFATQSAVLHLFNGVDSVSIDLQGQVERTFNVLPNTSLGGSIQMNANVNARDTQAFIVTNNTSTNVTINASLLGPNASSFSLSSPSTSVSVGGSNTLRVYYTPTTAGTHTATLRLRNGIDTTLISLTGTTGSPFGSFTVTPISIPGTPVTLSTSVGTTASQTFTIVNTTLAPITLNAGLSGSGSGSFNLDSSSTTIGAMSSGSITLNFAPQTAGTQNAVLTLANGVDSAVIAVQGVATTTGNTVVLTSNRILVEFNNVLAGTQDCQTIYITNPGTATVTVTEMSFVGVSGGGNQFTLQNQGGGDLQIGAGATDSATVCYSASQAGESVTANLRLRYRADDTTMQGITMVRLEGNAQPTTDSLSLNLVSELNFDALPGETECQTLRVVNPSALLGGMLKLTLADSNAGFTLSSEDTLTLGPLEVGMITICYTGDSVNPNTSTNLNLVATTLIGDIFLGSFNITLNGETELEIDEDITDTVVNGNCFRVRQLGGVMGPIVRGGSSTEQLLIENRTNSAMTINAGSITMSGQATNNFAFANAFPVTIPAFSSTTLNVNFTPTDTTIVSYEALATLDVEGSACGDLSVRLHGVGLPQVTADTGIIDTLNLITNTGIGGNVVVIGGECTEGTQTVAFRNDLNVPVTIGNLSFTGSQAANFTIVGSSPVLPATLQPGEIMTVQVAFECGQTPGFYQANLNISTVGSLQTQIFPIMTIQLDLLSVERAESGVTVSISPNPTRGIVRIEAANASQTRFEILNLLGNVVATGEGTSFIWNSRENGNSVSAGVYIVRVTGTNAQGVDFVETQQIVVE